MEQERADIYGDSYTDLITTADLFKLCDSIATKPSGPDTMKMTTSWVDVIRGEGFTWENSLTMFHGFVFYIDSISTIRTFPHNDDDDHAVGGDVTTTEVEGVSPVWSSAYFIARQYALLYGGMISDVIDASVTHVLVDSRDLRRLDSIRKALQKCIGLRSNIFIARVVRIEWMEQCAYLKSIASYEGHLITN